MLDLLKQWLIWFDDTLDKELKGPEWEYCCPGCLNDFPAKGHAPDCVYKNTWDFVNNAEPGYFGEVMP